MEEELIKCFVCQSKPQSADDSFNDENRGQGDKYNCLDPSSWKIFCHYFYPPPLVSLLDSPSPTSTSPAPENEHPNPNKNSFFLPSFCEVCYQTILNLCNLDSQLELIQCQISKIVAQVSLAFVQEEENQECDDNVIFSMRRSIRQRYQPLVYIKGSNLNVSNQSIGGGSINDLEDAEFSPQSIPSDDWCPDTLNCNDVDLFQAIKQEAEDLNSVYQDIDSGDLEDFQEHLNQALELPAEVNIERKNKQKQEKKRVQKKIIKFNQRRIGRIIYSSEEEEEDESPSTGQRKFKRKVKDRSNYDNEKPVTKTNKKHKTGAARAKPAPVKKIGENMFEYQNKWRFKRKFEEESGKYRMHCQSCKYSTFHRYLIIHHIKQRHSKEPSHRLKRYSTQRIVDDSDFRQIKNDKPVTSKRKVEDRSNDDTSDEEPESKAKKKHKTGAARAKPAPVKNIGENMFEYQEKWRFERKFEDESGKYRMYCKSCDYNTFHRYLIIHHIKQSHSKEPSLPPKTRKTQKIVNDNSKDEPMTKTKAKVKAKKKYKTRVNTGGVKKIGDDMFEYLDKWKFERKLDDESGKYRMHCQTCSYHTFHRYLIVRHIKKRHIKDPSLQSNLYETQKIDDNNFIYADKYPITRVTEPNGVFFKCGICSNLSKTCRHAKSHIRQKHIEGRRYVCEICGYSAERNDYLRSHMMSHEQVGKYICEDCGKIFKTKSALNSHSAVHTGKVFSCECGLKFSYLSSLGVHRRAANHPCPKTGPTPDAPCIAQTCTACHKEFVDFQKHVCKAKIKFVCDWCGASIFRPDVHKRKSCKMRFKFNQQAQGVEDSSGIGNENPFDLEDKQDSQDE